MVWERWALRAGFSQVIYAYALYRGTHVLNQEEQYSSDSGSRFSARSITNRCSLIVCVTTSPEIVGGQGALHPATGQQWWWPLDPFEDEQVNTACVVDISDPIYGENGYSYAWIRTWVEKGINCTGSILISLLLGKQQKHIYDFYALSKTTREFLFVFPFWHLKLFHNFDSP